MNTDDSDGGWLQVIAKSLAYLCLKQAQIDHKPLLERAKFLEGLGLGRSDAAGLLGTSPASLAELQRQATKKSSGGARGKAKRS